eukprot:gene8250-5771_t
MGNQLVVGASVRVEHISSELTEVSTLGKEGRNHFSTFRCKEHRHSSASPSSGPPHDRRISSPSPQWYSDQRRRMRIARLLQRFITDLEVLNNNNNVEPLELGSKLSVLISRARNELQRRRSSRKGSDTSTARNEHPKNVQFTEEIRQLEDLLDFLESVARDAQNSPTESILGPSSATCPVSGTTSQGVDVVVKVFSHPETCAKPLLRGLHKVMDLMANQLRIVDESRSGAFPANFLFCTFPDLSESGESASPEGRNRSQSAKEPSGVLSRYIFLKRPFVAYSLPERLACRPYLSLVNRMFIAFQLLKAVQTLHEVYGVTHGDIKPANVLLHTSGWLTLVDLAPYKPALLPMDRLTLFEYFYDAEDNRICYNAPEKFVTYDLSGTEDNDDPSALKHHAEDSYDEMLNRTPRKRQGVPQGGGVAPHDQHVRSPSILSSDSAAGGHSSAITGYTLGNINIHGHTATMDMFSVGCVLVYLFTEEHPFSLSDVLELRSLHSIEKLVERRNMVAQMLDEKQRRGLFSTGKMDKEGKQSSSYQDTTREDDVGESHGNRMHVVHDMISALLSAAPEERLSSSKVLELFTPSAFPRFFEYVYEDILPTVLSKTPDGQITFVSKNFDEILGRCWELEKVDTPTPGNRTPETHSSLDRVAVGTYLLSVLLPVFLSGLRSAATQRPIFDGLLCLQRRMLPYIPLADQIECVLPHLLHMIDHPEQFSSMSRLVSWRIVIAMATLFTATILDDTKCKQAADVVPSHTMRARMEKAQRGSLVAKTAITDPYVRPHLFVEHSMLMTALVLPALHCSLDSAFFSCSTLQGEGLLLELAAECPYMLEMAFLTLEWQHNHNYSTAAASIRDGGMEPTTQSLQTPSKVSGTPGRQGSLLATSTGEAPREAHVALWDTYIHAKNGLRRRGWALLQTLLRHPNPLVVEGSLRVLPNWLHIFGSRMSQEEVMPYLTTLLETPLNKLFVATPKRNLSPLMPSAVTTLFREAVLAQSFPEVSGLVEEAECSRHMGYHSGKGGPFRIFHSSLSAFVTKGLRKENQPALMCTTLNALAVLLWRMAREKRRAAQKGRTTPIPTAVEEQYFGCVLRAVPLLIHCHRDVGYAAAGVVVQACHALQSAPFLLGLCNAVRPFLVKPVPLVLLQAPLVFPQMLRRHTTALPWRLPHLLGSEKGSEAPTLENKTLIHQQQRFHSLFRFASSVSTLPGYEPEVPLSKIHMPRLFTQHAARVEEGELLDSSVFQLKLEVRKSVPVRRQSRSSASNDANEGSQASATRAGRRGRLLASLQPSPVTALQHHVERRAAIYALVGLGYGRLLCAGSKGVASVLQWTGGGLEGVAPDQSLSDDTPSIRYRPHTTLETVRKFEWFGDASSGAAGASEVTHSSPKSLEQEFAFMHRAYTCAQPMTSDPSEPLSSILAPPSLVALGSSLGRVSVLDVETGSLHSSYCCDPASPGSFGVTSMVAVQPSVVLSTASSGCVGILDIRTPSIVPVWSIRVKCSKLGIPTASCGLFHNGSGYAALVGTNAGLCQLLDLRFQLALQNTVLHSAGVAGRERAAPLYYTTVSDVSQPVAMGDLRGRADWRIGQICRDPLGAVASSGSPWVLLTTTAGPVLRLHVPTGEVLECLVPATHTSPLVNAPAAVNQQRLFVPAVEAGSVDTNKLKQNGSLRIFSGSGDGRIRQWDLLDCVSAAYGQKTATAVTPPNASCNSFTFVPFPFPSLRYYVRLSAAAKVAGNGKVSQALQRGMRAALLEGSALGGAGPGEEEGATLPPTHNDAVTALGVIAGNEFRDAAASMCLVSASRDGVVQNRIINLYVDWRHCRHMLDPLENVGDEARLSAIRRNAVKKALTAELIELAEKSIRDEITAYFEDMTVCRSLKRFGNEEENFSGDSVASPVGQKRSRTQKMMEDLCSVFPPSTAKRFMKGFAAGTSTASPFEVSCRSAATRILDALPCSVLSKQIAVLADTVVCVGVQPAGKTEKVATANSRKRKKPVWRSSATTGDMESTSQAISIQFYSTHLVDQLSSVELSTKCRPSSFSMQSVVIPGRPLHLECYTHHMVHFGFLCYGLWNACDELVHHVQHPTTTPSWSFTASSTRWSPSVSYLFPTAEADSVLILGLGGNVLGTCLDTCLPKDVSIDVVEIEPAMLDLCVRNGLVPPLSAPLALLHHHPPYSRTFSEDGDHHRKRISVSVERSSDGRSGSEAMVSETVKPRCFRQDAIVDSRPPSNPLAVDVPPIVAHRHNYFFYVMDASDFLRRDFLEPPPLESWSGESAALSPGKMRLMSPPPRFSPPQKLYNMIFLDCYDPHAGEMMHSASLLSECQSCLAPGGALLVNAHVDNDPATLGKLFLHEGFDSVQILRVSGCRQCVVVCLKSGGGTQQGSSGAAAQDESKRFSLPAMRGFAMLLNRCSAEVFVNAAAPIHFDPTWLRQSSNLGYKPEGDGPSCSCRLWEHHT